MVNCNPETVSTDYDSSDRLYFEPLTLEDVLAIVAVEKPQGVIVQFGGQTPLRLAVPLRARGRADHRHDAGRDRSRGGPRALLGAARRSSACARPRTAPRAAWRPRATLAERIGYPGARPAVVRARRARDADRLRHAPARDLHARGRDRLARASGADRPLPRRRDRGRRRRALRRQAGGDRAASWSTSRRRASTRATRRARFRRTAFRATWSTRSSAPRARSRSSSASWG